MGRELLVRAEHLTVSLNSRTILNDLSFEIAKGEKWVITGDAGTGKTTLLQVLRGFQYYRGILEVAARNVVLVEQQHHFRNLSNTTNFYYQQRFNSSDAEDAITVQEDLLNHVNNKNDKRLEEVIATFQLKDLLDERLIQLSNGENKRLQLAKAILDKPDLLLLDNPFIGLDTNARNFLETMLTEISGQGIDIIMVMNAKQLPEFVTHVLVLRSDGSHLVTTPSDMLKTSINASDQPVRIAEDSLFSELVTMDQQFPFGLAVRMRNVNISYHDKKILNNINWEIRSGERWSLSGPNGAGKSTLLSLITADNPQAYANDIILFDRKRGTGETIWEIKRKIGYISPELHLHFEQSNTSFEVIASGLFDTIGLFRHLNESQELLVTKWLRLLNIEALRDKMLFQLSNSEQRMVLLARALVKNPPMLVLDEPCQGLDDQQVAAFKRLISEICIKGNKTLIYVSHYTEEIPECVTKFVRINKGVLSYKEKL